MTVTKILLVDDVKFFLEVEKTFLKRPNCEILMAGNGKEALELIKKDRPDLVLMDLHMPEMDGYECCKAIKGDPSLSGIAVIMVTTAGNDDDMKRCLQAGCDDYINKPINRIVLLEKVKKYMEQLPVRSHVRVPVDVDATFTYEGQEHNGHISDISEGGAFIMESANMVPVDAVINVRFQVPGTAVQIEGKGVVVRLIEGYSTYPSKVVPGMGIRFTEMSDFAKNALSAYIESGNFMV